MYDFASSIVKDKRKFKMTAESLIALGFFFFYAWFITSSTNLIIGQLRGKISHAEWCLLALVPFPVGYHLTKIAMAKQLRNNGAKNKKSFAMFLHYFYCTSGGVCFFLLILAIGTIVRNSLTK